MEVQRGLPVGATLSDAQWLVDPRPHQRAELLLCATESGEIAGIASCYVGSLHQTRAWVRVDVAPHRRREGIGSRLVPELLAAYPGGQPFAAKVVEASVSAKFLESLGARISDLPASNDRCPTRGSQHCLRR